MALERIGIRFVRQRGSHLRYKRFWRGQERHVTLIAGYRQVPARTLSSILKQAGLTAQELSRLIGGEQVAE
ncbi:MAG: type II toxin-antitoxin system HicA family toxin [Dehalococcoidia bacterium]